MRQRTTLGGPLARMMGAALLLLAVPALADPRAKPDGNTNETEATELSPELQEALRDLLNSDSMREQMTRPLVRAPAAKASPYEVNWNRTDKADGSTAMSVKKPLPLEWDTNIGADLAPAGNPAITYQPDRVLQSSGDYGSGAAWANITVPGLASVDARVDPAKEQSKLGTTFSRSLPVGGNYSITLQNTFAVTDTLANGPSAPLIAGASPGGPPAQVWSNDRLVKFNILSTGTTLAAGTSSTTVDNVLHNKFGVEQKLFDAFNVTTAVTDVGNGRPTNKSITAGFKFKW